MKEVAKIVPFVMHPLSEKHCHGYFAYDVFI